MARGKKQESGRGVGEGLSSTLPNSNEPCVRPIPRRSSPPHPPTGDQAGPRADFSGSIPLVARATPSPAALARSSPRTNWACGPAIPGRRRPSCWPGPTHRTSPTPGPAKVRLDFWRRLYHAHVHAAVDRRVRDGAGRRGPSGEDRADRPGRIRQDPRRAPQRRRDPSSARRPDHLRRVRCLLP